MYWIENSKFYSERNEMFKINKFGFLFFVIFYFSKCGKIVWEVNIEIEDKSNFDYSNNEFLIFFLMCFSIFSD